MSKKTTALGYPYYEATDSPAGHSQQQTLAEFLDANPGVGAFTQTEIDGFTTAQKRAGRIVYNKTTGTLQKSNGSAFSDVGAVTYVQSAAPSSMNVGDGWLDTSASI